MPKVNIIETCRAGSAEKCKLERFVTTSRDVSVVLLRQDSGREFQKQFFQAENPNFQWGSISTMCFPQDDFRTVR